MRYYVRIIGFAWVLGVAAIAQTPPREIRIGHFPNITHAQALLARANGAFEKALGLPVKWVTFNAGPSAVEALFTDAVDATYIGPNPAINGFLKSKGESFQIVAGAASGGAALVARPDASIESDKDFNGKIVATPQLGNTQDVAARAWLREHGYKLKEQSGTVTVLPLANPDQLLMFQRREIDAAWTVEPWVSRLELEAGGRIFLEESSLWPRGQYVTAVLVVSRKFLKRHPEWVEKLVAAHVQITSEIETNKAACAPILNEQIRQLTGSALPAAVLDRALQRVHFTWAPLETELRHAAQLAHEAGFLRETPDLTGLYNLDFLQHVLEKRTTSNP
jgi:NitT/TauT family transport system substrate-binding protein